MVRPQKTRLSTVQIIVILYGSAITLATLLLSLPIARKEGVVLSFVDTFFTAVSAISVTGLTVVNISETFSVVGIIFLIIILQIGGIGIMSIGTFIWIMLGRKIGLRERQLIMTDQNRSIFAGVVSLMLEILGIIIVIELIGAVILGSYFLKFYPDPGVAFYHGLFASVSATTNAGFDITGSSLIPFAYDYFVQGITVLLMVAGAIGFPVLVEIKDFLSRKYKRNQFSLFAKLTTSTYLFLLLLGTILIFVNEYNGYYAQESLVDKIAFSLFHSTTARSTGLTTLDITNFSSTTQFILVVLMFIGASPSSVGGGIRTTTFALIILGTIAFARGKTRVKLFRRELHPEDILKSYMVLTVALVLTVISIVILTRTEAFPLLPIVFEVASAFGTCGLSLGITPELSTIGKLIIACLMFIGRIGILSFLILFRGKPQLERIHYPQERIVVGQ